MEKMSRQEKILIIMALLLCAVMVIYGAVTESRAKPENTSTAAVLAQKTIK